MTRPRSLAPVAAVLVALSCPTSGGAALECSLYQITDQPTFSTRGPDQGWVTPDGASVVFVSDAIPPLDFSLYTAAFGTSVVIPLVAGPGLEVAERLSQNGRWLGVTSTSDPLGMNPDGSMECFLFDRQSGQLFQLTDSPASRWCFVQAVSSDGDRVYLDATTDFPGSGFVPIRRFELTRSTGSFRHLAGTYAGVLGLVAPDTRQTAFIASFDPLGENADGSDELFLFDEPRGALEQVTHTANGHFNALSFSADERILAFATDASELVGASRQWRMISVDRLGGTSIVWLGCSISFGWLSGDATRIVGTANNVARACDLRTGEDVAVLGVTFFNDIGHPNSAGTRFTVRSTQDPLGRNGDGSWELFGVDCSATPIVAIPTIDLGGRIALCVALALAALFSMWRGAA